MKYFLLVVIMVIFSSCFSSRKSVNNFAYQYQNRTMNQAIDYKLYRVSGNGTRVYLEVETEGFLPDANNEWHLLVHYQWYDLNNAKVPIDTAVAEFAVSSSGLKRLSVVHSCGLPTKGYYSLHVFVQDQNGTKLLRNKWIVNADESKHHYLPTDLSDNPLFNSYLKKGSYFKLHYEGADTTRWLISYYKPITLLALPPFMEQEKHYLSVADSVFEAGNPIDLSKIGTYFFTPVGRRNVAGFVLVCTDEYFPKLTSALDLAMVTRYITKNEEYKKLINANNIKLAIDSFWLQRAGSTGRGKELIKEYYGRVQRANQLFTGYKEGWKTDKGLIYVIYGEPEAVWIDDNGETWQYSSLSMGNIFFNFECNNTIFDKQYFLLRNATYDSSWHEAVFEWRKGIVGNKY